MKKKELRRVLRAVVRLLERDIRDIADQVVEIDHREAEHWQRIAVSTHATEEAVTDLDQRLARAEATIAALVYDGAAAAVTVHEQDARTFADTHSRKV